MDDDGNGYVDDVHGYDFSNGDGDPMDDNDHGTHVAGTIAAVGNNGTGVVGVNWRCRIVAIKFLDSNGSGTIEGAIQSVQYAIAVGVRLTNNSCGGSGPSQAFRDAIAAAGAANQPFVAAAGNEAGNNDANPHYPSSFDSPHILAVAATNADDGLAGFSNYGFTSVDLGAPGVDILSTIPGGEYDSFSGTSMATPHVSGACALVCAHIPGIRNTVVKDLLLLYSDPVAGLAGRCVSGGRLNAYRPLTAVPDTIPPAAITNLAAGNPTSFTMVLTWTATGDDGLSGVCRRLEIRYSTSPIDASNVASAALAPAPPPQRSGASQSAIVSGLAHSTTYYFAVVAFDEWGNSALSNVAAGTTLGVPILTTSTLPEIELPAARRARSSSSSATSAMGTSRSASRFRSSCTICRRNPVACRWEARALW